MEEIREKFLLYLSAILISFTTVLMSVWVYPSISKEKSINPSPDSLFTTSEDVCEIRFPINVNTASLEELQLVPGIGPKMAEEIGLFIKVNGQIKSLDSLMAIKGIKEKKVESLKEYLTCK